MVSGSAREKSLNVTREGSSACCLEKGDGDRGESGQAPVPSTLQARMCFSTGLTFFEKGILCVCEAKGAVLFCFWNYVVLI